MRPGFLARNLARVAEPIRLSDDYFSHEIAERSQGIFAYLVISYDPVQFFQGEN